MAWIIIGLLIVWHVAALRFCHKRRLHLFNYLLYILLDDSMLKDQKSKVEQLLSQSEIQDRGQLFLMTRSTLENFIEGWAKATPSTIAAQELLWNVKQQTHNN